MNYKNGKKRQEEKMNEYTNGWMSYAIPFVVAFASSSIILFAAFDIAKYFVNFLKSFKKQYTIPPGDSVMGGSHGSSDEGRGTTGA